MSGDPDGTKEFKGVWIGTLQFELQPYIQVYYILYSGSVIEIGDTLCPYIYNNI